MDKSFLCVWEIVLRVFFLGKEEYKCTDEEKQDAREKVKGLSTLHQMMIVLHTSMQGTNETFDYNGQFNKTKGEALLKGYAVFEPYGWYFENEAEKAVLDGTHDLYAKDKMREKETIEN